MARSSRRRAATSRAAPTLVDQYVDLNNDDTVHGRAYVGLDNTGATLTLTGVDGGSGGTGALEIRYSVSDPETLDITVNGAPHPVVLEDVGNDPSWRHTNWRQVRIEGVVFSAGATNTVVITTSEQYPGISLDDVLITTADELASAEPHRRVLALSPADRDALLAFLRQLDGSSAGSGPPEIFRRQLRVRRPDGVVVERALTLDDTASLTRSRSGRI